MGYPGLKSDAMQRQILESLKMMFGVARLAAVVVVSLRLSQVAGDSRQISYQSTPGRLEKIWDHQYNESHVVDSA